MWRRTCQRAHASGSRGLVGERSRPLVLVNDQVLRAAMQGDSTFGVRLRRAGNNSPELRRNLIVNGLLSCASSAWEIQPVSAASNLRRAMLVHSAGFVRFMETAFSRWVEDLNKDASYLLTGAQDHGAHAEEAGLVPFHCTKSSQPRGRGLASEFACFGSDFETPIFRTTSSVLAADVGIIDAAVDKIGSGSRCVYALVTHPGHHAGPSYYSGFCYINTACIACASLARLGMTAALLDLDFHGGNGSFDIMNERGGWFRSINCADAYPWVDMGPCGIEVNSGVGWQDGYSDALELALADVPAAAKVLVVSLGYDTLFTDPEAGKRHGSGLALTVADFQSIGKRLGEATLPVLVVQEGGYDLQAMPAAAQAFLEGLAAA
eukprot:TRINITY_DN57168_c0_g1_i1.p1 TRINITY_DN57168_c0_g1~~TRINITY_DN57168_c0_g1_i1.p1  ORF type:complete len:378 (-),score=40.58 TRINITY_DN57168_c0_g1_i1:60-1193(-)